MIISASGGSRDARAHMEQASPAHSAPAPPQATTPRFSGVRALGSPNKDGSFFQAAIDHRHQAQAVAIKYIPRSKLAASSHRHVLREVLNHHQLSLNKYPHIVQFKEVFVTPRYLGIVMEQVDGCDLQTYLLKQGGKLQVDIARFLFQQLVLAVDFMHKRGKVHRDLRLSNILVVDSGVMPLIKLRNFSLSKNVADDSPPRGQVGAALFTAPEVVLNVGGHPYDGELVDSWSCGVILFMMLFGHHPFLSPSDMALGESEQVVRLIENEVRGQLFFPEGADPLLCDLVRRMLVPAPKQRYPISSVMLHAWYQKKLPPGALQLNSSYLQVTNYEDVRQSMSTIKQLVQAAAQGQEPQQQPASTSALSGANAQQTPAPRAPASSPLVPMRAPTLSLALPAKLASTTVAAPQDAGIADAAAAAAALVDLSRPAQGQVVAWHGLAATQGISIGSFIAQPLSLQHLQAGTTLSLEHAAMRMYALSAEQLQGHPAYGGALSAALLQHQHQL